MNKSLFPPIILLIFVLALISCGNSTKKVESTNQEASWAVQFADAVMARHDSLIYYNGAKPKYEYDYAFLAMAIDKLGNIDEKYSKYAKAYIDYFVEDDGTIRGHKTSNYNIDRIRPGNNMIDLYIRTGDEKYKVAIETLIAHLEGQPRTNAGGFWHKKRYPYQMWLDGIYMGSPFMARYATEFNQPHWFNELAFQIKLIYDKTVDAKTGLMYHAWDESREQRWCNPETGQSKHFWSRAMGWYVMAIVDVLDVFPENHQERNELIDILNQVCHALIKVQDSKTGLWYQVLDMGERDGNYIEGSGSAMFIYAFAKGAKNGYLPEQFLDIANKSFDALIEVLVIEGEDGLPTLSNVCGGCGLGGNPYREADYDYYINEKRIDNDQKGVAPLILAAIELNK